MNYSHQLARTIWNKGLDATDFYKDSGYQDLRTGQTPYNARPNYQQSSQAFNYPAAGPANAVTILSYTTPKGYNAVFNLLCIAHIGGGFPDFGGNVIWRVKVNGGAVKGLGNLIAQVGQLSILQKIAPIILEENDLLTITVEIVTGGVPQSGQTAAVLDGYEVPVVAGGLQ